MVVIGKKHEGRWYIYVQSRPQPQAAIDEAAVLVSHARSNMWLDFLQVRDANEVGSSK